MTTGRRRRHLRRVEAQSSSHSREIPREMLQEILVKLPTKDVARCCCVSRLWRSVVSEPSFRHLHAANYATALSADTEVLFVLTTCEPGRSDGASIFSMSLGKAMFSFDIPSGYDLANVCNGLLCYVHGSGPEAPAVVCNPVTGETLALPRAPPLTGTKDKTHLFALGFSPPTNEYKLLRFSKVHMAVYTLGDTRRWRQHSFHSPSHPAEILTWPPLLIDGKLYVVTIGWKRVLVVDVLTETYCTYRLPEHETLDYARRLMGAFELDGQLCFVKHVCYVGPHFWVMSLPKDDKPPQWDLRYNFHIKEPFYIFRPWSAWADDGDKMLCYMNHETLYKYDTRTCSPLMPDQGQQLRWDQRLQIPVFQISGKILKCDFIIRGGYRPTLLSPLTFALPPSQADEDREKYRRQFKHTLSSVLYGTINKLRRRKQKEKE
ncbi:hypothetical protein VPH35_075559 [Triticum aestivum]